MMNNAVNGAPDYATPDRQVMKASQSHFNTLVADNTFAFLPAVMDKTLRLRAQLNTDDQHIGDHIKRAVASLGNVGFASVLARLEEIQSHPSATASLREEKLIELVKYCARRVESTRGPIQTATQYLHQGLGNLEAIRFAEAGVDLVRIETDRRIRLEQAGAGYREDQAKLQEEKRTIDAQIEHFQAPGWLDIFDSLIPSTREIESAIKLVTTKKPDREFLELVLARLKGNLEGIENGRRYSNLTQARDGVRTRLDEVQKALTDTEAQIQDAGSRLQKLEAIASLDQVTRNWVQEAQKLLTAYEHFLQTNEPQLIRDVLSIQAMAGRYTAMLNYLGAIAWR